MASLLYKGISIHCCVCTWTGSRAREMSATGWVSSEQLIMMAVQQASFLQIQPTTRQKDRTQEMMDGRGEERWTT